MAYSKHWCELELDNSKHKDSNLAFANHVEEDEIYLLPTIEIAEAQEKDQELKVYYKQNAITQEDSQVLCKDDKLVIPASLSHRAVSWYHHYLQHPGHSCFEETMRSVITGKVYAILSGHTLHLAAFKK
jgi:hypothetical protein